MPDRPHRPHLVGDDRRTRLPAGDTPGGEDGIPDFTTLANLGENYTRSLTNLFNFLAAIAFIWMLASLLIAPAICVLIVEKVWP